MLLAVIFLCGCSAAPDAAGMIKETLSHPFSCDVVFTLAETEYAGVFSRTGLSEAVLTITAPETAAGAKFSMVNGQCEMSFAGKEKSALSGKAVPVAARICDAFDALSALEISAENIDGGYEVTTQPEGRFTYRCLSDATPVSLTLNDEGTEIAFLSFSSTEGYQNIPD